MQITRQQAVIIGKWAEEIACVSEAWLFGSRARGDARHDSDIDIAISLESEDPGDALGTYYALGDTWQREIRRRLGIHVSLVSTNELAAVEATKVLVWSRKPGLHPPPTPDTAR
jgi:predicted nucleotidyltransferase